MRVHHVVLIAFKEFDNLGVGYLASVLSEDGYETCIIDFRSRKEDILGTIRRLKPLIVGFSVIYQYYIYEFQQLVSYLRQSGISSHFCAGGQYASLRYKELFEFMPSLDSAVRFEGEYTFLELVRSLHSSADWHNIRGIVYKMDGEVVVNPVRPPETDIDRFPFPMRSSPEDYALGKKFATLIAARGCVNNCSFCNNTEYIRQSSINERRVRTPANVVKEMQFLYEEKDCSVFLFDDDDFPVKTEKGYTWAEEFCNEIRLRKLSGKIMWKINCRPDEVDFDIFSLMKKNGLFLVFLGIDDGTDCGLKLLNKHMTVEQSLNGINTLKKLEIGIDYGFMLFQPSSTFRSVSQNLRFLRTICSDGYTPVLYLKLIPFFETKTEKKLIREGRLKGKPGFFDYDFPDNSLDYYYKFLEVSLSEWINHPDGLGNVSKWARNYISVYFRYYDTNGNARVLADEIKGTIAESNRFLLDTMEELVPVFESNNYEKLNEQDLKAYTSDIKERHEQYRNQIVNPVKELGRLSEYQRLKKFMRL